MDRSSGNIIEFGCGYGTFTIPLAQKTHGTVYTLDIYPWMVSTTAGRALHANLKNVIVEERDFVTQRCGRADQSASRVLRPGGLASMIHWKYDERTPRGPPLNIRPRTDQCRVWEEESGLRWLRDEELPGSPWHWGMVLQRL